MRHRPFRSRFLALSPLLAGVSLIGWTTGCSALPESITSFTRSPAATVAVADSATTADPSGSPVDVETADVSLPAAFQRSPGASPTTALPSSLYTSRIPAEPGRPATAGSFSERSAATEALIVEELALAPPEERTDLATEWAELDSGMVEQVIRIRRMVRQLESKNAADDRVTAPAPLPTGHIAAVPAIDPTGGGSVVPATAYGVGESIAYTDPTGRIIPPGSNQFPIEVTPAVEAPIAQGATYDPQVRPAAYLTPAPPADRGDAPRPRNSPLFPGLPPAPAPLEPPSRPSSLPRRVAEALPSPAALLAPGETEANRDGRRPYGDPGPTGFGSAPPAAGPNDFDGRLDALEQVARRRADRAAEAVRNAVGEQEKKAAERQRAEAEIHLRLLHLVAGEHGRALEAVPGLPPAEQEFWQHTFWALSTELDTKSIPDPADRATHAVAALRTAAVKLSERANLTLKDVNFCHRVDSFGNVQTFDRDEFTPNEPVLIYAAVENFTSERTLEGRFRTVLKSKVEIFRAGGTELVETLPLDKPMTVDLCDNHRQDYFLIYELKIPARIGLGPHVLKLTVQDTLGNATAETELNFTVK